MYFSLLAFYRASYPVQATEIQTLCFPDLVVLLLWSLFYFGPLVLASGFEDPRIHRIRWEKLDFWVFLRNRFPVFLSSMHHFDRISVKISAVCFSLIPQFTMTLLKPKCYRSRASPSPRWYLTRPSSAWRPRWFMRWVTLLSLSCWRPRIPSSFGTPFSCIMLVLLLLSLTFFLCVCRALSRRRLQWQWILFQWSSALLITLH